MQSIEQLRKRKQLNVQEQNALLKHTIVEEAIYWRNNPIPSALDGFFRTHGVNVGTGIFLDYERHGAGSSTDVGYFLTANGNFFDFDIDLSDDDADIICVNKWEDVSTEFEVTNHKKGIGATRGFLALEVLREINTAACTTHR